MANNYVIKKIATAVLCMVMVQVLDLFCFLLGEVSGDALSIIHMAGSLALCVYAFYNVVLAFSGRKPAPAGVHQISLSETDRMVA